MGIQINGQTDRITAIDGTIDFVSNIGNIGLITASNYVLQDSITIGAGSTVIKASNGKLGIGTDNPLTTLHVRGTTHALGHGEAALVWGNTTSLGTLSYSGSDAVVTAANNLKINVNGSERASIKSTGQVAIGTVTAETNFLTTINGDLSLGEKSGTDNTFIDQKQDGDLHLINSGRTAQGGSGTGGAGGVGINKFNNISGGTSLFRDFTVYDGKSTKVLVVDGSASRVGIGTDAPSETLSVVGSASFVGAGVNYVRIGSSNAGGATLALDGDSNGDGSGADYCMIKHDTDGHLKIYGDNPANAADIVFHINSATEKLRLTSAGHLQLQGGTVYGDDSATATFKLQSTSGNSNHARIEIGAIQSSDNGGIHFYTAGSSTATRYMTLKGGGNLGIGIDNPTSRLYVNGVSSSDVITARTADSNGNCVLNLLSEGTTGSSRILFSDTAAATGDAWISYSHNDRALLFTTAGTSNERLRITNAGGVISKASLFNNYQHLVCQGGSGGDGIKNYILVCKTNTAGVRLSGHFVITRQAGASGIAISKIEANIISNNSAGDFRYQTRSMSTRGSYPGMEGRWVTLTYGGNNYYAIRIDPATDSSRWASKPDHCYFTGTENNCVGNGLGTIIDDNANTITSITELDDIQGTTVSRNSYNYIKEGYLSVQGGSGQAAMQVVPYELNVNNGAQPTTLTVKAQKAVALDLNRMYSHGTILQFRHNNDAVGYFSVNGTSSSHTSTGSDIRLKKDFEDWTEEVLPHFKSLKPQKFRFNSEDETAEKTKGYMAQDNLDKFPEAYPLNPDDDRYWFAPSNMVPYLMKALQEEIIKREEIEAKYNALESRISALESA